MKKVISMLLVAAMCCGMLVGCGSKTKGIDKELYSYAVEAVEIVDSYLDSELTTEEAAEKMKLLSESAELVKAKEGSDEDAIKGHISLLSSVFDRITLYEESEEDLAEDLEKLELYKVALKHYLEKE